MAKILMLVVMLATVPYLTDSLVQKLKLVVNGRSDGIPFKHFWRSTGFCPPSPHQSAAEFDLSADMKQNLAYIGAVPHSGIQQVRIHWLLDLITVPGISINEPIYDFKLMDPFMDLLYVNGLNPGFELMGSPSGIFTDMENKTQVYWWRHFVRQVAGRYIMRNGLDWVREWNFETWNEPDCHDFDDTKMTVQGFLNYYDACSEGLKDADLSLHKFGGPGDGCDHIVKGRSGRYNKGSEYAEALYAHVVNGTNYFTGEKGVRMDFISLHRKGGGKASNILKDEIASMSDIKSRYPELANKPFYNNEADPLVGWSKDEQWRADASYAAVAVKVIGQHQNILIAPGESFINYTLLSNDNGFLSYYPHQFTQRTLLARFQMNFTTPTGNDTKDLKFSSERSAKAQPSSKNEKDYVTFIRKPIYAAMVLLSKLGDQQIFSQIVDAGSGTPLPNDSYAGVVTTTHVPESDSSSDTTQWAAIVYSSSDTLMPIMSGTLNFDFTTNLPNAKDMMLAVYSVNNQVTNPYMLWRDFFHKPDYPSLEAFQVLRRNEGPYRYSLTQVTSDAAGRVTVPEVAIYEPDVLLLHLCANASMPPEQVTGVRTINITAGQVLIVWSDTNIKTKCIKTYEVEQSATESGPYQRVNTDDTIVNLFVYATGSEAMVEGFYRVRAVDYWERPGATSSVVKYSV